MKMLSVLKITIGVLGFSWLTTAGFTASPAWLTAHDAEVKALVGRMTLAEKAGQMTQPNIGALKDLSDIKKLARGSVLSGGSTDPKTGNQRSDWTRLYLECQTNALQSRLGIPLFYGIDAVHGHNNVLGAVIFPHHIGLGATRDPALIEQIGRVTAAEVRATGLQWTFAPSVAAPRDIRWGRTFEGFSENPALVAELGAAMVRGLQGPQLGGPASVLACAKHFIADGGTTFMNSGGKIWLNQGDARMDEAALRAVHLAGYPAAIAAGVGTIMPSFSSWNGVKCSASKFLLTDLLKKELGFAGFLISDYNAIDQIVPSPAKDAVVDSDNASGQVRTLNYKKCIEISINAGMDMVMRTDRYGEFITSLMELVQEGKIPMERIDDAVTRILRVKLARGLMQKDAPLTIAPELQKAFGSAEHRAVARAAVRQSLVLLKNEGRVLPLSKSTKRIHMAGRGADDLGMQCGGLDNTVEGEGYFIKGDRLTGSVDLPGVQNELIKELAAANPNVVLVVISGGPCAENKVLENVKGLLYAIYPGQEGGRALADILCGRENPSGKLPVTVPKNDGQLAACDTDFRNVVTEGVGYRWFDSQKLQPEFAFGFGLSYTTFQYQNLRVTPERAAVGQEITVQVDVVNTGARVGEEVVQLYLTTGALRPAVPMPVKQLKGFKKVAIAPGQTNRVTFTLTPDELYIFDAAAGRYRAPTGAYAVHVGGSSDALPLSAPFTLKRATERPDLLVANIRTLPAFPEAGERVVFVASVFNRGTGPTPAGKPLSVAFRVNGQVVSWSPDVRESIPAGGMALVCASEGEARLGRW